MYHVPLDFKCIYGVGDKRCENVDGEDMSEVVRKINIRSVRVRVCVFECMYLRVWVCLNVRMYVCVCDSVG